MWIDPYHASTCFSCSPNVRFPSLEFPTHTGKAKRSSARRPPSKLESHALRCLKGWLRDNRKNPYPDADTKRSLAQQCGITEKQINTWFTNARARGKFFCRGTSDSASEDEAPAAKSNDSMSPATQQHDSSHANTSHSTSSSHSQESSVSSTSRKGKKKDYGQLGLQSYTSHHALHVQPKPVSSTAMGNGNGPETWQCTFCYQHIAHKSWRRHEETQHRPKRKWTCLLTGPSLQIVSHPTNSTYCVFCKVMDPSEEHFLLSHRISECTEKSEGERTFLRPDHLRQHVKNFHKAPLDETVRDLWRKCETGNETTENWICGFCGHELRTWNARETHIARHFKDGLTMADWKEHAGLGGGIDTGKKRPTSSEGRPNTSPKVARMRTSLPVRQQHQHELDIMMANGLDSSPVVIDTHAIVAPSTPDAAFDCFIPQVWDQKYADTSGMGFNDQGNALDSGYDSALPDLNTGDFDFEGLLDLSECWLS
ncbi:monocarboxylate transporter 4 [Pyrenophora seminiperda CCB06]|uniref:Monocarboxylate transporter 4 n=1 Tax=Pyrenophora seminiperda CCB06 TaxID=1302712 RepID=A0A3M7LW39_9PLEO|nr:monocarboxylate transporter 4 [Pyrenophora seminiperda CCB06]